MVRTRTKPFRLNKETGEPNLIFTQENRDPWKLVISFDMSNRGRNFRLYQEAKSTGARIKETHPEYEITIVSRQAGYGPPYSKIDNGTLMRMNQQGLLWCPYCRKMREFLYNPSWQQDRCPVCRISKLDFHVKKNNYGVEVL